MCSTILKAVGECSLILLFLFAVSKQSENLSSDLSHLKECISVLFSFTRRVIEDPQFKSDLLMWLQRLVRV